MTLVWTQQFVLSSSMAGVPPGRASSGPGLSSRRLSSSVGCRAGATNFGLTFADLDDISGFVTPGFLLRLGTRVCVTSRTTRWRWRCRGYARSCPPSAGGQTSGIPAPPIPPPRGHQTRDRNEVRGEYHRVLIIARITRIEFIKLIHHFFGSRAHCPLSLVKFEPGWPRS